jgi:YegS/Rv2252/BmrU family lipid kinase
VVKGEKILFIINKHSGTGFQPAIERSMLDTCHRHGLEGAIEYTKSRGHATSLAKSASANGFHYVIAVGGDGTINEVARGLLNTQTTMGIIPRGSGNGLARHLGISINLTDAIDLLFDSKIIKIDTFTVNEKLSLNVSGIGFDGHVANLFANKSIRGLFGYAKLTFKEFFKFSEFEASVTIAGNTVTKKAFIIAFANSSQYGNNVRIAPSASICDELLHVNVLKKPPLYRLDFIYSVLIGSVERSTFSELTTVKELCVKTSKPVPFHVDGEPSGFEDTFNVKLNPASLLVLVPKGSLQNIR